MQKRIIVPQSITTAEPINYLQNYRDEIERLTKANEQLRQSCAELSSTRTNIIAKHNKMLKKQRRHVYDIGNVIYVISHDAFAGAYDTPYFKIGKATQKQDSKSAFMRRLTTYNTGAPFDYKVEFLMYVENNSLIEDSIKLRFEKEKIQNKEWIAGVSLDTIIEFIIDLCNLLQVKYIVTVGRISGRSFKSQGDDENKNKNKKDNEYEVEQDEYVSDSETYNTENKESTIEFEKSIGELAYMKPDT
jgi:hypothetical protein